MSSYSEDPNSEGDKKLKSSSSLWDELPDDLWIEIFNRSKHTSDLSLVRLSSVCKRFLTLSVGCVTSIAVTHTNTLIPPASFFSRFSNIKNIGFYGRNYRFDAIIAQIAQSNLPLEFLSMDSQTHFPTKAMSLLGPRMKKTLRFLSCTFFDILTDNDLAVLAGGFHYLHELDIEHPTISHVTDKGICAIATQLKSLVYFNIMGHENISHKSFEYLASNCPLLRNLSTEFSGFECSSCLDHILLLKSLTTLQLRGRNFSKNLLIQIMRADLKLKKLGLEFFASTDTIDGAFLCRFLRSQPFLGCLELTGSFPFPTDIKAREFAASVPNVKIIRISTQLNRPCLSSAIFFNLLRSCPLLEVDDVGCDRLDQDWLSIRLPLSLITLNFENCELCDETLMFIVSHCPKLLSIDIRKSSRITRKGREAIVATHRQIKLVIAHGSYRILPAFYLELCFLKDHSLKYLCNKSWLY